MIDQQQFVLHVEMPGSLLFILKHLHHLFFLDDHLNFIRYHFLLFYALLMSFKECIIVSGLLDHILDLLLRNQLLYHKFLVGLPLSLRFRLLPILVLITLFLFLVSLFLIIYSFFKIIFQFFPFNDSFFIKIYLYYIF